MDPRTSSHAKANAILNNADVINHLTDDGFKKLLCLSEDTAKFALTISHVRERLDRIDPNSDSQTFPTSCTARCILKILRQHNLIEAKEYTRSKEFEIYQKIWDAPFKEANPDKIVQVLQEYKLNVKSFEIPEATRHLLAHESFSTPYTFFKRAVKKENLIIMHDKEIKEGIFKPGVGVLLVVGAPSLHIVYAEKTKSGKFVVTDPDPARGEAPLVFNSFSDFYNKSIGADLAFTGVGFVAY